jgi:hypothetical protein
MQSMGQLREIFEQHPALVGAVVLIVGLYLWRRIRHWRRLRRPAQLNPNLAKYGGSGAALTEEQRREAEHIVATSSTESIAGYELIRQIEAVYVDGFRHPEEALLGLKAAAALKGANAVIHVSHSRSSTGRFAASGDAVVVESLEVSSGPEEYESEEFDTGMTEYDVES